MANHDDEGDTPIVELTFEEALEELEDIVARLESGGVKLEESIDLYDRGRQLRSHCQRTLDSARERVEKVAGDKLESVSLSDDSSGRGGDLGFAQDEDDSPF